MLTSRPWRVRAAHRVRFCFGLTHVACALVVKLRRLVGRVACVARVVCCRYQTMMYKTRHKDMNDALYVCQPVCLYVCLSVCIHVCHETVQCSMT